MESSELKVFLDEKYQAYATPEFLLDDPIQIPHAFSQTEDIEIAGLFAALFAWGQRKTIINKANQLLERMDRAPFAFVKNASKDELNSLSGFVHRTFNDLDILGIVLSLRKAYDAFNSLEPLFIHQEDEINLKFGIRQFRNFIAANGALPRSLRHLPDPFAGSAAKRINMYLRWMVRKDLVDFGLWQNISPSRLSCPLDVHSGRVARSLGLLNRTQNDWAAVIELDTSLRHFDPEDPVKYDFALFGLGVYEGFK